MDWLPAVVFTLAIPQDIEEGTIISEIVSFSIPNVLKMEKQDTRKMVEETKVIKKKVQ